MGAKVSAALATLTGVMDQNPVATALAKGMDTDNYSMKKGDGDDDADDQDDDEDEDDVEKSATGDVGDDSIAKGDGDDDEDDQDDEEDDDDDDDVSKSVSGDEGDDEGDDDVLKSLQGEWDGNDDELMAKALNAAPVLDRLASGIDAAFGQLRGALKKSMAEQEGVNEALLNAQAASLQMMKSLTEQVTALNERLDKALGAPKPKKSAGGPGGVVEKSVAGTPAPGANPTDRGVGLDVVQDKIIKGINAEVIPMSAASEFDRTRQVSDVHWAKIKDL